MKQRRAKKVLGNIAKIRRMKGRSANRPFEKITIRRAFVPLYFSGHGPAHLLKLSSFARPKGF
jgi:hypothetical protein